jgi:hypothetical protein
MDKFWMLLVDGRESCHFCHMTLESARREAERLLNLPENLGKGVTILSAIEYGKIQIHPIDWALFDPD